eukprot:c24962_g8_i1 orf=11-394(-)
MQIWAVPILRHSVSNTLYVYTDNCDTCPLSELQISLHASSYINIIHRPKQQQTFRPAVRHVQRPVFQASHFPTFGMHPLKHTTLEDSQKMASSQSLTWPYQKALHGKRDPPCKYDAQELERCHGLCS